MKNILILSDSIALSREFPEKCLYENCWPQKLKDEYIIHQVSMGGATIKDINNQIFYNKMFKPDIVILQVGIVDCAPRSLTKFELDFINRVKFFGKIILKFTNRYKYKLRKYRKKTYTSILDFNSGCQSVINSFPDAKIYSLSIIPADEKYESKVPGVIHNVKEYNQQLKNIFKENYIDLDELPQAGIMSDSIHVNKKGHDYIYRKIKSYL